MKQTVFKRALIVALVALFVLCSSCGTRRHSVADGASDDSQSLDTNPIITGDTDTSPAWHQNISNELAALDKLQREYALRFAASAYAWSTRNENSVPVWNDSAMMTWFGTPHFFETDAATFGDAADDEEQLGDYLGRGLLEVLSAEQRGILYGVLSDYQTELDQVSKYRTTVFETVEAAKVSPVNKELIRTSAKEGGSKEGAAALVLVAAAGQIFGSLQASQIGKLDKLRTNDWDVVLSNGVTGEISALSDGEYRTLMDVAFRVFTWCTADPSLFVVWDSGDVANYFGLSDFLLAPTPADAIAAPPRTVEAIGEVFLETLSLKDRQLFYNLPLTVWAIEDEMRLNRNQIVNTLATVQDSSAPPVDVSSFDMLARESGRLDAWMTIEQAEVYAAVFANLSNDQLTYLKEVRRGAIEWDVL